MSVVSYTIYSTFSLEHLLYNSQSIEVNLVGCIIRSFNDLIKWVEMSVRSSIRPSVDYFCFFYLLHYY